MSDMLKKICADKRALLPNLVAQKPFAMIDADARKSSARAGIRRPSFALKVKLRTIRAHCGN